MLVLGLASIRPRRLDVRAGAEGPIAAYVTPYPWGRVPPTPPKWNRSPGKGTAASDVRGKRNRQAEPVWGFWCSGPQAPSTISAEEDRENTVRENDDTVSGVSDGRSDPCGIDTGDRGHRRRDQASGLTQPGGCQGDRYGPNADRQRVHAQRDALQPGGPGAQQDPHRHSHTQRGGAKRHPRCACTPPRRLRAVHHRPVPQGHQRRSEGASGLF